MAQAKRMSDSFRTTQSPVVIASALSSDSEEWVREWQGVYARDLIDSRIVSVSMETSVEDACDVLLSEDIHCLAVESEGSGETPAYLGLFDFSDVNAFLTLAATRHTLLPEDLKENPRLDQIVTAARAGRVPVHLVSDLSEKNPLQTLPNDASIISLLEVFSRGAHRVLIQSPATSEAFVGMVSDRRLLAWLSVYAEETPTLSQFLSSSLNHLSLPSLNIHSAVIAAKSTDSVLQAMKLMSDQGVSSIAVIDEKRGTLSSAVSVTDIGKIVVPSQSNQILSSPLHQFISRIKAPDGSTDGIDKYPVYSVFSTSALSYTVQKLLATNAHRLFVTSDTSGSTSPGHTPGPPGNVCGIVSVVDILSLFARLANIPDVDPTQMQRHRRASSTSSQSSKSERDRTNSRSSSRSGVRRTSQHAGNTSGGLNSDARTSTASVDAFQWSERSPQIGKKD